MGRSSGDEGPRRKRGLRLNSRARQVVEANRADFARIIERTADVNDVDRALVLQVLAQEMRGHRVRHLDREDRPDGWRAFGSVITAMRERTVVDLLPVLGVENLADHLGVGRGAVLNLRQRGARRPFWLGGRPHEKAADQIVHESTAA